MKFLCDRCKTRYSIGDDRVRGKILKIRCKNCANVITVREGMSDEGAADDAARRGRPTTGAPNASYTAADHGAGPLGAKPPAALEEEWYVSIDGEQSGPYSLAEAQKWVGSKAWDADLHCWSEGFDDWLAVDKVSHFRNLRKKPPAPQTPPPLPRVGGGGLRAQPVEDEPKPLFAATMASLEKGNEPKSALPSLGSSPPAKSAGFGGTVKTNGSAKSGPAVVPAIPMAAKAQPTAKGTASVPAAVKDAPARPAGVKDAPARPAGVKDASARPAGVKTPAPELAAAFDASDDEHDPLEARTAIGVPAFTDDAAPGPQPVGSKRTEDRESSGGNPFGSLGTRNNGTSPIARVAPAVPSMEPRRPSAALPAGDMPRPSTEPRRPSAALPAGDLPRPSTEPRRPSAALPAGDLPRPSTEPRRPSAALPAGDLPRPSTSRAPVGPTESAPTARPRASESVADALEDDENLEIGEVSRVVKLADIAKMGGPRKVARAQLRSTATVQRISYREVPAVPPVDGETGIPNAELAAGESVVAQAVVTRSHRRATIMLLAFAAVLLLGVSGAVILLVTSSSGEDLPLGLGHSNTIDTSRPEDYLPGHRASTMTGSGSGTTGPSPIRSPRPCPPYCSRIVTNSKGSDIPEVTDPSLKGLEASEIEDMAAKQGDGTRRCYMRAQKGALGFEIADLKKITVTLMVDKDGVVKDVQLSDHAADALGTCLIARIKAWKFRASKGGTYRISLAFSSG